MDSKVTGWCIVSDARRGNALGIENVVYVDQAKEPGLWWTSDDDTIVMVYRELEAAEHGCRRFKHNNPRVVDARVARRMLRTQRDAMASAQIERVSEDKE